MIQIHQLFKKYGDKVVLNEIDLNLERGTSYALLGKNGVGKTTLIRSILDLIRFDSGSVQVFDKNSTDLNSTDKARIGVVGDDLALIEEFNAIEYLKFVAKIYKMPAALIESRMKDLLTYFFENEKDLKKSISKYSTGMKKKVAFCSAVMHTPDVLILDEPFSGLDPMVANQMIAFLNKYQNGERLILISSHDLSYVEKMVQHILILNDAEIVYNNSLKSFTEEGEESLDDALLKVLRPNNAELDKMTWL